MARLVGAWAKARLPEITAERESEQSVSLRDPRFPYLNIYGRIDLIEKLPDESLRITDFKTGSAKRKSEVTKEDAEGRLSNLARQLAMYAYLLEGSPKWKGIKVSGSRLEFLKDKIYNHTRGDDELKLLLKDIADYDEALRGGTWVSRECYYNSYGKATVCEYCKMAEIYTS